jgi:hypothetical protein
LLASTSAAAEVQRSACADAVLGARVVAISGGRLGPLRGAPVSELRMWQGGGGNRLAIPFQVDACDERGHLVLRKPGADSQSVLGPESVLLFRIEDAGDRDPGAAAIGGLEVGVRRATETSARWAYVARGADSLALSPRDDVDFDRERDVVHARRYTLAFDGSHVSYFALADGKGNDRGNLIDRFKARVDAHFLWGLFRFQRNEDQVTEEVIGYEDGPIRVVRRSRIRVEIGWGLPSPTIFAEDYFYADHAEAPVYISLPFSLAYVFGDLDVRLYLDFRGLDGFRVAADGLPDGSLTVGSGGLAGPSPTPKTSWFLLDGGQIAFFHRLRFGPTLGGIDCRLFYVDDPTRRDPPESVVGLRPAIGYRITGWGSVGRGSHEIWMDTYVVDGPLASTDVLGALAVPFQVEVHPPDGGNTRSSSSRALIPKK